MLRGLTYRILIHAFITATKILGSIVRDSRLNCAEAGDVVNVEYILIKVIKISDRIAQDEGDIEFSNALPGPKSIAPKLKNDLQA
ncbi:hypothetical protein [cyanobacterium endosymbiont of Rhopalodia gibberula]|uniref:hypothetical protein n=1 Tax=cyanobacterium endosymbiont of Rhopalodia gibberula TaxID=1763363 RepID=UPI000E6563D1|nr:hypothetical protein [cyanobacterium endosymbiont of Rhopalodia gibberula]